MTLEYPKEIIWYIQSWTGEKVDLSEGSAVAIRLQKKGEPQTTAFYLLTCAHVVRGARGGTRVIRAWPPGIRCDDEQALTVFVAPEIKELPAGTPSLAEQQNAPEDWAILKFVDSGITDALATVKNWLGKVDRGDFRTFGYPGGKASFRECVVAPTMLSDAFPFHSSDGEIICLTGDGGRPGVSGGGVFREGASQFAGLHRGRFDDGLQIYVVAAPHIFSMLDRQGYEAVSGEDSGPINLEPFISKIVKQLCFEPTLLSRLEEEFGNHKLDIEKSRLGADAGLDDTRADALARTLVKRDFVTVIKIFKDTIDQCTLEAEERNRQILFSILCWFLPAYDPHQAESLREKYARGDVHLIEVDVASALAAELLVSGMQKTRADIRRGNESKRSWEGVSGLPGQKLPLGLGESEDAQIIRAVEGWLFHLLQFDPYYHKSPEVYRQSLLEILKEECESGKKMPYIVFSLASMKGVIARGELERIASAIRKVYPPLAILLLSDDDEVHAKEPARLHSLRQILERFY